jgi:peptidoglycan/xylan/chitin deacetylase (PgdA/CDA1 family)
MATPTTFAASAAELQTEFATHPLIRAVNFHSTARINTDRYEKQLAHCQEHFSSVNEEEMDAYLTTGLWHKPKPGLIISVFEGFRNSYDVLLPLIEKHGFVGWFWMITSFINTPVPDQLNYAEHHRIHMLTHEYPDGRYALTWDELRDIDRRKHVIASHSRSHSLLAKLPPDVQLGEVVGSQEDFKKELGHPVRGFVSLTGPAYGETPEIDKLIDQAGYTYELSNFRIQRLRAK